MNDKIKIVRSKRNIPCLWEKGGKSTKTSDCTIIASGKLLPKKPLTILRNGHLSNSNHALIPIEEGDYVLHYELFHDEVIKIYKIIGIEEDLAILFLENEFSMGEWNYEILPEFVIPIRKLIEKGQCYHCRKPYFIANNYDKRENAMDLSNDL